MVTQTILCSLVNRKPDEPIYCRYGEKGRQITFQIDDPETVLTPYTVTFYLYKPDNNFVVQTLEVDNYNATLTLSEQMTSLCGKCIWDLRLTKNNELIYTFNGEMYVDTPTVTNELIESVSEVNGYIFPDEFQTKLTAGDNIKINEDTNTISGDYKDFTGATLTTDGKNGLVPKPLKEDKEKYLCGDGTWGTPTGGGSFVKETLNLSGGSSAVELTHNMSEYDFIGVTVSGGNEIHWFEIPSTSTDFYMGDVSNVNDYDQYALTQGMVRINPTNNTIQNVNMTMFHYIRSSYKNMYQNRSIVNVYLLRLKE